MVTATINACTEQESRYGGNEKELKVTLTDGTQTTVYCKPKAHWVYTQLATGQQIELKPKDNGPGYLVQKIIANASPNTQNNTNGQQARPRPQGMSKEEISEYITTSAGQYAYCVKMLRQKFEEVKILDITDDILKAGATSIFISLKDKLK